MKQCWIKYLKNGPYDVHMYVYWKETKHSPVYHKQLWAMGVVIYLVLFVILPIEVKMITTRLVLIKRT